MKKLFLSLLAIPCIGYSQSGYMPVQCGTLNQLSEVLVEYDEKPYAVAETTRQTRGTLQDNIILFFVNVKSGTYTIAEKIGENTYCVISSGKKFTLVHNPV